MYAFIRAAKAQDNVKLVKKNISGTEIIMWLKNLFEFTFSTIIIINNAAFLGSGRSLKSSL